MCLRNYVKFFTYLANIVTDIKKHFNIWMRIRKDTSNSSGLYSCIFVGHFHWVQRNWTVWNISSVSRLDYKKFLRLRVFLKNSVHTQISLNILYCIADLTGLFTFITPIICLLCRCIEPSEWILDCTFTSLVFFFYHNALFAWNIALLIFFFQNIQILSCYMYICFYF